LNSIVAASALSKAGLNTAKWGQESNRVGKKQQLKLEARKSEKGAGWSGTAPAYY
jgi:hypothetical protein